LDRDDRPKLCIPKSFAQLQDLNGILRKYHEIFPYRALPRIARDSGGSVFGGNGSLMRVLPVGLAYWRKEEGKVGDLARESSGTMHRNAMCQVGDVPRVRCAHRGCGGADAGGAGDGQA
jgi:hypothetical protein